MTAVSQTQEHQVGCYIRPGIPTPTLQLKQVVIPVQSCLDQFVLLSIATWRSNVTIPHVNFEVAHLEEVWNGMQVR